LTDCGSGASLLLG